jgi:hypothetical protein
MVYGVSVNYTLCSLVCVPWSTVCLSLPIFRNYFVNSTILRKTCLELNVYFDFSHNFDLKHLYFWKNSEAYYHKRTLVAMYSV